MEQVGQVIASVLTADGTDEVVAEAKRTVVAKLCQALPPGLVGPELAWEKHGCERILGGVIFEGAAK